MSTWGRWVRQPQNVFLRKALFQIHLWTGIGVGLYIFVVFLTGSLLVYRGELVRALTPAPMNITGPGEKLSDDALKAAAVAAYPGYTVSNLFRPRNQTRPVEIWLKKDGEIAQRLFDPYTGKDLAPSVSNGILFMSWLVDLHDNLLGGRTGRLVNGVGGVACILLALTGVVIWWPGIQKWWKSLYVRRKVGWKRFNWDLHSALGIWSVIFVLMFGVTGAYLAYPDPFLWTVGVFEPETDTNLGLRAGDEVLNQFARWHFGRFGGTWMKASWAALGVVTAALFVTGTIMWWNRVVRPSTRREVEPRVVPQRPERREAVS